MGSGDNAEGSVARGSPRLGDEGRVEKVVDRSMTAAAVGSGLVEGLATPAMIALMEGAAVQALAGRLEEGASSVGTSIDVRHMAPTPVGMRVSAQARLTEIDGRRLIFSVTAADEVGTVGQGTHERYIVDMTRFAGSLAERANQGNQEVEDR